MKQGITPYCAYLYYLTYKQGTRSERIYEYFDPDRAVNKNTIVDLISNAYADGSSPPCYTTNHELLMMRRKSYLVFVADGDQSFIKTDKIVFSGPGDGKHTFMEGGYMELTVYDDAGAPKDLVALYCKNYMYLANQSSPTNLGNRIHESFVIEFKRGTRFLDPGTGGTNMGPPVPPPNRRRRRGR